MYKNKMSYLWLVILFSIAFGCDPSSFATYCISNNTSRDLKMIMYANINDTITINSYKEGELSSLTDMGGRIYLSLIEQDSILIYDHSSNDLLIKYYPTSTGKNIYKTDDQEVWDEYKKGKRDYKYIFEITEEDISGE